LFTVSANVVLVLKPRLSVAVIVTIWFCAGPSVVPNDQLHVPLAFVPDFVTVPTEAVRVTVSAGFASDQVPVFEAVWPSFTVTVALSRATVGAEFP
jgi:hypothetical protein